MDKDNITIDPCSFLTNLLIEEKELYEIAIEKSNDPYIRIGPPMKPVEPEDGFGLYYDKSPRPDLSKFWKLVRELENEKKKEG